MLTISLLAIFSVLALVFVGGYKVGINEPCAWCEPTDPDESTPIYDGLLKDMTK